MFVYLLFRGHHRWRAKSIYFTKTWSKYSFFPIFFRSSAENLPLQEIANYVISITKQCNFGQFGIGLPIVYLQAGMKEFSFKIVDC